MPNKTRPAQSGATYKQDVRLRWSRPKPDAAPNGAEPVLVDRGYKDFAPTELGATKRNVQPPRMSGSSSLPLIYGRIRI